MGFQAFWDQKKLAEDEFLNPVLEQAAAHLTMHIAEHAPDCIFVHAGVVEWKGRALLLPAVSYGGKSTLVAELVRAGATYYSDEFAPIDRAGRVHPFLRELRMRRLGQAEQCPVAIEQFQGRAGNRAVPISMVLFTQFEANGRWAPERLSPGRAALEMLLHTIPVQRTPARVLATLSAVMSEVQAWSSARGEAADIVPALLGALGANGALA